MVLIAYSDSDSDIDETSRDQHHAAVQPRKRKAEDSPTFNLTNAPRQAPPLPSKFSSLYATNVRTSLSDDPSLHGGRKRQIVHVQGNWPSHVYLEWLPNPDQLALLDDIISRAQSLVNNPNQDVKSNGDNPSSAAQSKFKLTTFLRSALFVQLPLHVSLSAPLVLSTSTKESFRAALTEAIAAARIEAITVHLASLDLVSNFEKSRWFLILKLAGPGTEKLADVLNRCNQVCEDFGLARLYQQGEGIGVQPSDDNDAVGKDDNSETKSTGSQVQNRYGTTSYSSQVEECGTVRNAFHISIAWMLEEVSEATRVAIRQTILKELIKEQITFDRVKIKIGNVVDDISL